MPERKMQLSGKSPHFSFALMFGRSAPSKGLCSSILVLKRTKTERSSHESPNEEIWMLVSNPRLIPNNQNLSREILNLS
jgi:hypothetical protein